MRANLLALGAVLLASVSPAVAATSLETVTFGGTLQNGYNGPGGPFGATNYNLAGTSYSVALSYDPSLFVKDFSDDSCGAAAGTSCYFTFSAARPLTEVVTVGGVKQTYTATSGGFTLGSGSGSGPYGISFSFQNNGISLSISGYFQSNTSFFPDPNNVNNPALANVSNLVLTSGTFNQSGNNYSLGANPTSFSAALTSGVPEPASWSLFISGFGLIGSALRRRRASPSFA